MSSKILRYMMLIVILTCGACDPTAGLDAGERYFYSVLPSRTPWYGIGFFNDTEEMLTDVHFDWPYKGKFFYCEAGKLIRGATGEDRGAPDPIPPEGTVFWKTSDGVGHSEHVIVASTIKGWFFDGTIWFKIGKDGVKVEPVTAADAHERALNQKRTVP